MAKIISNGLEFEVEDYGDKSRPAVLLIMGLAAQLTRWPNDFVESLVEAEFRVIAFDNRDIGLSQKLDASKAYRPMFVAMLNSVGLASVVAPYKLTDMASDSVGLLDALNIERAHVIGVSMGGMIGQILCADFPARVASFTAIMSSTNNPVLPQASANVTKEVFTSRKTSSDRAAAIEDSLRIWNLIGTKNSGRDPEQLRQQVTASVDRNRSPAGIHRQIAAIIATRDLRGWTRRIAAPSLVIHGSDDPLVPTACGLDIAAEIRGSKKIIIEGLGHDLPPRLLPTITTHVLDHLRSAEKVSAAFRAA